MKVAFIAPRRPDGGRRDVLWAFCQQWWADRFPGWPIHTADTPGVFNRGAAINLAASQAPDADVLVIIDGDVVADETQVQAAVDRAAETGRLTFAYTEYRGVNEAMSDRVLAGFDGNWTPGVRTKMNRHVSSILAVPRALWDQVGGFDERCEGWGQDDLIFAHCCRVLGGGCERIPGMVWHLHHPPSPHRAKGDPHQRAADALATRYLSRHTPTAVTEVIAERSATRCALVVVTDGRPERYIDETIDAARENLKGLDLGPLVICDDSADLDYHAWLRWRFPDAELHTAAKRGGFAKNVRRAWSAALATGMPWVFWLEDDFTIDQPIDLAAMADTMTADPELVQVLLRRQPWFPGEVAAGGIIDEQPDAYTTCRRGGHVWEEHQLGYWTNPHLVSRSFLAAYTWPDTAGSEARFGRQVMTGNTRSAFWGHRDDPPTVTHKGVRHGSGY